MRSRLLRGIFMFLLGGYAYCIIEVLTRGYSHISMLIAGGLAFLLIGETYEITKHKLPAPVMMLIGAVIITTIELVSGIIVNLVLKLQVWDYSIYTFNYKGQICLLFSVIWYLLSYSIYHLFHIINMWTYSWYYNENKIAMKI